MFFEKCSLNKKVKRRPPLNEGVCLKLAYCAFSSSPSKDATMSAFWGFLHFLSKFKPFDEFFSFQNVIANSGSARVARVCVCVYIH